MSRKVYVTITARIIINMNEGVEVSEVIDDMNYSFDSNTVGADIFEEEIIDFEITDSK